MPKFTSFLSRLTPQEEGLLLRIQFARLNNISLDIMIRPNCERYSNDSSFPINDKCNVL